MKTIRFLGALFALVLVLPAQVVRACNYGGSLFYGWHRCTTDSLPPHYRGMADGVEFAAGKAVGLMGYVCDVRLKLAPGTGIKFDLGHGIAIDGASPKVATDTAGMPVIGGAKVQLLDAVVDGAGTDFHWRGRPWADATMFCADIWATVYPGQPWAVGELVVTASNPLVPDLVAAVPPGGMQLGWSNGIAIVDGLTFGAQLLPAGETFGDGQSRAWRFVFGWLDRSTLADVQSSLLESAAAIAVNGISKPGLLGAFAPVPRGFDAIAWGHERLPKARAALLTWEILRDSRGGSVGDTKRAGDTGDHEDWPGFNKGVEEQASPQPGTYWIDYYAGMRQVSRPCHDLEADGSLLDLSKHPDLSLWVSRPNVADTAVKDSLGKPRPLVLGAETHGWEGPDTEHWLIGRLSQALQWTGSPALQWELQHEARIFMLTETLDPRFATTSISDASRAWGFWMTVAIWCWELLEDRELAVAVRQRALDRAHLLIARWSSVPSPAAWFDVRRGELNVGGGFVQVTMPYQQNLPAATWTIAGELFGDQALIDVAQRMARPCVDLDWTVQGGVLVAWDWLGFNSDGTPLPLPYIEGQGAHRSGFFDANWCVAAPWAVLRYHSDDARSKAILAQIGALPTAPPNQPVRTNDWLFPMGTTRAQAVAVAIPVPIAPVK